MKTEKYTYSENTSMRTYAFSNGTNRQDLGYEYDLNGNILKKKNRTPDCGISGSALGANKLDNQYTVVYPERSFSQFCEKRSRRDAINRLKTASGRESQTNAESYRWQDAPKVGAPNASNVRAYNRSYTYDKVGNVLNMQQTGGNAFTRLWL